MVFPSSPVQDLIQPSHFTGERSEPPSRGRLAQHSLLTGSKSGMLTLILELFLLNRRLSQWLTATGTRALEVGPAAGWRSEPWRKADTRAQLRPPASGACEAPGDTTPCKHLADGTALHATVPRLPAIDRFPPHGNSWTLSPTRKEDFSRPSCRTSLLLPNWGLMDYPPQSLSRSC